MAGPAVRGRVGGVADRDLRAGEILSLLAWMGLGATVTLGTGSIFGLALLLMVPIEAAAASSVVVGVGGLAGAALVALVAGLRDALRAGRRRRVSFDPRRLGPVRGSRLRRATGRRDGPTVQACDATPIASARDRYRALTQSLDDVVMRFDRTGAACHVGCAAQRLFGLAPQDLAGRGFFERLHVADRPVFLKLVADVAAEGQSGIATLRLRTGRTVPSRRGDFEEPVFATVDLSLRPPEPGEAPDDARRPAAAVGLMRDVSARAEQDRLAAAAQDIARAEPRGPRPLPGQRQSRVAHAAQRHHRLFRDAWRAEALEPPEPAKRREYAGIIHQSGLHLLSVVNGILDASKIESGSFDLAPELVALDDLLALCCDMMGLKAEQGGVRLVASRAGGYRRDRRRQARLQADRAEPAFQRAEIHHLGRPGDPGGEAGR